MRAIVILSLVLLFLVAGNIPGHAQDDPQRAKNLNFEGDVVEGVNKQPLDTLNQISDQDKRNSKHLYRKRSDFQTESSQVVHEVMETY